MFSRSSEINLDEIHGATMNSVRDTVTEEVAKKSRLDLCVFLALLASRQLAKRKPYLGSQWYPFAL